VHFNEGIRSLQVLAGGNKVHFTGFVPVTDMNGHSTPREWKRRLLIFQPSFIAFAAGEIAHEGKLTGGLNAEGSEFFKGSGVKPSEKGSHLPPPPKFHHAFIHGHAAFLP